LAPFYKPLEYAALSRIGQKRLRELYECVVNLVWGDRRRNTVDIGGWQWVPFSSQLKKHAMPKTIPEECLFLNFALTKICGRNKASSEQEERTSGDETNGRELYRRL